LHAWTELTHLARKEGKTFDPKMVEAVKSHTEKYFKKNSTNGEMNLLASIQGLQKGIAAINSATKACTASSDKVDVAALAIKHFKMFTPAPCVSVPSHSQG
jgi:hypothetical protein